MFAFIHDRMLMGLDGRTQKLLRQAMEGGDTPVSTPSQKLSRSSARKFNRSSAKQTPRYVLLFRFDSSCFCASWLGRSVGYRRVKTL